MELSILLPLIIPLIKELAPEIQRAFQAGEISPKDQKDLMDAVDAIRSGLSFKGPEWEVQPNPAPVTPEK